MNYYRAATTSLLLCGFSGVVCVVGYGLNSLVGLHFTWRHEAAMATGIVFWFYVGGLVIQARERRKRCA